MRIDHVTVATSSLDRLREAFARVGLATDYGGPHSNGITHMALLGFDDGSYIELISALERGTPSPWWDRFIAGDAGPCAWAVGVEDVAAEAARIAALGIPVRGPQAMSRQRPDGRLVEWDIAFIGEGDPGLTLPFIIKDRTPREWRVAPSASVSGSELKGLARVVIGVREVTPPVHLFQTIYGWQSVRVAEDRAVFDANLIAFEDTPVILAAPTDADSGLAARVALFGEAPVGYLIATADMARTASRLPLGQPVPWMGQTARWLAGDHPALLKLGFIES